MNMSISPEYPRKFSTFILSPWIFELTNDSLTVRHQVNKSFLKKIPYTRLSISRTEKKEFSSLALFTAIATVCLAPLLLWAVYADTHSRKFFGPVLAFIITPMVVCGFYWLKTSYIQLEMLTLSGQGDGENLTFVYRHPLEEKGAEELLEALAEKIVTKE